MCTFYVCMYGRQTDRQAGRQAGREDWSDGVPSKLCRLKFIFGLGNTHQSQNGLASQNTVGEEEMVLNVKPTSSPLPFFSFDGACRDRMSCGRIGEVWSCKKVYL